MFQQEEGQEEYLMIKRSEITSICSELSEVRKRLEELEKSQQ
jgi:hypothetical protein